jgi:hypothetical protein
MIEVIPLEPWHIKAIHPQKAQRMAMEYMPEKPEGISFTIVNGSEIIGSFGWVEVWHGRYQVWMLLAEGSGKLMVSIFRVIRSMINAGSYRRLELQVDEGFPQGYRFAQMLGFEFEYKARKYFPNGNDAYLFAKFKGE